MFDDVFQRLDDWKRISTGQVGNGEFIEDLKLVQEKLASVKLYPDKPGSIDGVWGPNTAMAVEDYKEIIFLRGQGFHTIMDRDPLDLRTVDDMGPVKLRPGSRSRYYKTGNRKPRTIVIHWTAGPTTAEGLYNLFSRTDRAVSSHWAIDPSGTYQYLPGSRRGFHATWINRYSIGIDICQPVVADRFQDAIRAGYDTMEVDNTCGRGAKRVLSLDPKICDATGKLVVAIADYYDIPLVTPDNQQVQFTDASQMGSFKGVLGHHHVDRGKWDVAPWMKDIEEAIKKHKSLG